MPAPETPIPSHAAPPALSASLPAATRIRYRVLGMAVLLAAVTYLDRVCISITAPAMRRDLGLSQVEMSFVFSAFTLAYAIFEIPTGQWGDRVGTRRVLLRIVESGFDAIPEARRKSAFEANSEGWTHQTEMVRKYLALGEPV